MLLSLISLSESTHPGEGVNPYVVGGGAFGFLVAMLLLVLVIGGGRDHT